MPTDKFAVRLVIATVAAIAIVSLVVMAALALRHDSIPRGIDTAFTLSIGLLGGFIAKTSTSEPGPPVAAAGGVNVTEAPAVVVAPDGDGS